MPTVEVGLCNQLVVVGEVERDREPPIAQVVEYVSEEHAVAIDEVLPARVGDGAQRVVRRPVEHALEHRALAPTEGTARRAVERATDVQCDALVEGARGRRGIE